MTDPEYQRRQDLEEDNAIAKAEHTDDARSVLERAKKFLADRPFGVDAMGLLIFCQHETARALAAQSRKDDAVDENGLSKSEAWTDFMNRFKSLTAENTQLQSKIVVARKALEKSRDAINEYEGRAFEAREYDVIIRISRYVKSALARLANTDEKEN